MGQLIFAMRGNAPAVSLPSISLHVPLFGQTPRWPTLFEIRSDSGRWLELIYVIFVYLWLRHRVPARDFLRVKTRVNFPFEQEKLDELERADICSLVDNPRGNAYLQTLQFIDQTISNYFEDCKIAPREFFKFLTEKLEISYNLFIKKFRR